MLRHNAFKHENLALPLPRSLVKKSCQAIASDSCYGTEINAKFELYCRQVDIEDTFVSEEFCSAAKKALSKLVDQKSKELFYAEYYSEVVNKSTQYFSLLKEHEASLQANTVCEKLVTEFQSVGKPNAQCDNALSTLVGMF